MRSSLSKFENGQCFCQPPSLCWKSISSCCIPLRPWLCVKQESPVSVRIRYMEASSNIIKMTCPLLKAPGQKYIYIHKRRWLLNYKFMLWKRILEYLTVNIWGFDYCYIRIHTTGEQQINKTFFIFLFDVRNHNAQTYFRNHLLLKLWTR